MSGVLDFWFEFGSTYSYLTVNRIDERAAEFGIEVRWKPFLLGPLFADMGWSTSPFNLYPAKGRYMWRDVERRAALYGLPFRKLPTTGPAAFPQNGLYAARIALIGLTRPWGRPFCRAVFDAQFVDGRDISDRTLLFEIARKLGAADADLARSDTDENKQALRNQTQAAAALGVFGAPSFTIGSELFWGDDRLDDALRHACGDHPPGL